MPDASALTRPRSGAANGANGAHARNGAGGGEELQRILDELVECASLPLENSRALPASVYKNQELYELEVERIWRRSWLYAGRVEEIPQPGDWMRYEAAGEPLVIVRNRDGEIRALSRICPHRFMDVLGLEGATKGNSDSFVCPYHSWAFDQNGALAGAPLMEESERFEREKGDYCLKSHRVSVWRGFVFVNLDDDADPLEDLVSQIDPHLGNYALEDWRKVDRFEWGDSPANWKLALDNGREAYHHQGLHKDSLEPLWPAHMVQIEPTDTRDFFVLRMFVSREAAVGEEDGHLINPTLLPPAPGLTPFERSNYLAIGIYPSLIVLPGPDVTIVQTFAPTGPQSHEVNFDFLFHESVFETEDWEAARNELRGWIEPIQAEDSAGILALQRAINGTRRDMRGGALSRLERPMWSIQRFLANRLTGADV